MSTPEELTYTSQHEWLRRDGDVVTVGITHYAQDQLGDVVYVDLPSPGARVERDQPFGEVESTKSVSDLYAPFSGEIVSRNEELDERPELVNSAPYTDGWMVTIRPDAPAEFSTWMDAAAYRRLIER